MTTQNASIPESRADAMVRLYGEVCNKQQAARILNCSPNTVKNMLADGRLDFACGGEKVDVRSIARYIEAPRQADFEAHRRKICRRNGTDPIYAV